MPRALNPVHAASTNTNCPAQLRVYGTLWSMVIRRCLELAKTKKIFIQSFPADEVEILVNQGLAASTDAAGYVKKYDQIKQLDRC